MAAGKKTGGGSRKGVPNKATADIKEAAKVHGPKMLDVLAQIAMSSDSDAARVSAANAVLDRAYGKPKQAIDVDANVKATVEAIRRTIVDPKHDPRHPNG